MKGQRLKHVPMRTCVGCRRERPKRELVRVVCGPTGVVSTDPTGKAAGRGAYLCPEQACWELALKRKNLDQALKTTLSAEDYARLRSYAAAFAHSGLNGQQ
ncbi:MAG: YlxR family protein [Bacteroidetes bacterium]|nr:YlxR family protein [Bacteroidota bacterium]MCL5025299.1 YlxR family protein [Chloroflexota bacterium]